MHPTTLKAIITVIVVAHLAGNVWHGDAHTALEIALPETKTAFVMLVILAAPLLGVALLWFSHPLFGYLFIALSLLGSVLFSVYHHYVMVSIDNVDYLPQGSIADHTHFIDSAEFIALSAIAGTVLAFYAAGRSSMPFNP
ncbi:MAG: hypothetical protein AB8B86_14050 [Pseudomonadales bacterium]